MEIEFTVPGEPQGKGRPRFSNVKGRTVTRTPGKTVLYENLIVTEYLRQAGDARFPDGERLALRVTAYFAIPRSASGKKKALMESGGIRPAKKPDLDNIIKVVADSLNAVAYRDDAQITDCRAEKFYSGRPRLEVGISAAGGESGGGAGKEGLPCINEVRARK